VQQDFGTKVFEIWGRGLSRASVGGQKLLKAGLNGF
jgi:hypothetical protein